MRSAGRSKSKRSVRMTFLRHAGIRVRPKAGPSTSLVPAMTVWRQVRGGERLRPHRRLDDLVGIPDGLSALDLVDGFPAFDHLAPNRVLVVEEAGVVKADEKLTVPGIGTTSACHRDRTADMGLTIEFGLELLSRPAGPRALRASRLCHEAVNHAVEHNAIVEPVLDEFLDARDVTRRKIGPHFNDDVTFGGLQSQRIFRLCHLSLSILCSPFVMAGLITAHWVHPT